MSLFEKFALQFHVPGEAEFFAPGRVNLIGEHIDYCGGLVMPMAIDRGSRAVAARNDQGALRIYSERFDELREIPLASGESTGHWSDFVVGVVSLMGRERTLAGVDIYVTDNIGAGGLSSSASFALLIAHVLLWSATDSSAANSGEASLSTAAKLNLAQLCQHVEHDFVGVNCGIMDQASIALGNVIKLNCSDLTFDPVTTRFDDCTLLVMDTRHERTLAGSKYNERVNEIGQILEQLTSTFSIHDLCEIQPQDLSRALSHLNQENLRKRLRHVVTENQRVIDASDALKSQRFDVFGQLMNLSHDSLHFDYEVTGDALHQIVMLSRQQPGVFGARMTGAGFGGCAIALVAKSDVHNHNAAVHRGFVELTGKEPNIFAVRPGQAAGIL